MEETPMKKNAQLIVENAMNEITRATRKALMDYVFQMYHNSLAKAIVFLGLDSPEGKELLSEMDEKTRRIVESAAHGFHKNDEEVICEVEHILTTVGMNFDKEYEAIKENLLFTNHKFAENSLNAFRNETPIFKNRLDDCIFNFEDLILLDDRAIQLILRETDSQDLARALKGASTELKEKFFCNMPKSNATMLLEDMEFMGPARKCDMEKARAKIAKTVFKLAANGDIIIKTIKLSDLIY